MVDSVGAIAEGLSADDIGRGGEHILIEDETAGQAREPQTVSERLQITNRAHGKSTEFTFYAEGFLTVRFEPASTRHGDVLLDLRFLDPTFRAWRRRGKGGLIITAAAFAAATLGYVLTPESLSSTQFAALAAASLATAICGLLAFLYRWEERIEFATQHGRARVLSLSSSFGCLTKFRRAARRIARAANGATAVVERRDSRYFKEEMRAHYALRDRGTISAEVCAKATARILSEFG